MLEEEEESEGEGEEGRGGKEWPRRVCWLSGRHSGTGFGGVSGDTDRSSEESGGSESQGSSDSESSKDVRGTPQSAVSD